MNSAGPMCWRGCGTPVDEPGRACPACEEILAARNDVKVNAALAARMGSVPFAGFEGERFETKAAPDPDVGLESLPAVTFPALRIVTLAEFAGVDEPGRTALVGDGDLVLIPEDGNVMFYGDGGAGKTTLAVDLACHLAAGDTWLGVPIPEARRVLLVENEGPRPLFRRKLARKLQGWHGSDLGDRVQVLEHPWAVLNLADESHREALAEKIGGLGVDMVAVGPLTRVGMDEAGTLQQVRDFTVLLDHVRRQAGRPVTFVLVHHENKGGKVSGAWEGAGDTLFHVTAQGNGSTRLYVQKSRWSTWHHATTMQLRWADGDGFELADAEPPRPERVWEDIEEYVLAHGGCGWVEVERAVSGQGEYLRRRRDAMLGEGVVVNVGRGQKFALWHRDDPARPSLHTTVSEGGHGADTVGSVPGDSAGTTTVSPCPVRSRDTGTRDTVGSVSPANLSGDVGA